MPRSAGVDHDTASDCDDRRELPEDKTVTGQQQDFVLESQLRESRFSRCYRGFLKQHDFRDRFSRALMEVNARPIFERSRRRQKTDPRVQPRGRLENAGDAQHHSSLDFAVFDSGQVHRGALAGDCVLDGVSARMKPANADAAAHWVNFNFIFDFHRARNERAGDDCAEALHGERAVNWQAKVPRSLFRGRFARGAQEFTFERIQSCARFRADGHDGRAFQE